MLEVKDEALVMFLRAFVPVLTCLEVLLMELGHLLECSSCVRILLYYDLTTLGYVLLWGWWGWIHVATQQRWWVEILLLTLRGLVVYFFPLGVVLKGYLCHFAVPVVVVCVPASVRPGSLISSFSAYRVNLVNVFIGFAHCSWYLKYWQYQKFHHLWLKKLWV